VVRYGGSGRYETAQIIAEDGLDSPDTVLLADGNNFPDAIGAGAAGGVADAAVLLTGSDQPSDATNAYLDANDPTTFAIGGPAARAYPDAEGIVGNDRYDTNAKLAREFFDAPTLAGLARGSDFADALSGGAAVGGQGGPLLLSLSDRLPDVTREYLEDNAESIDRAYVFGGTAAISDDVLEEVDAAITE
jgi:putative cell wall-binding protein